MSEQTARQRRDSAKYGWMVAVIGLLVAVILGWAMMAIGAGRLRKAEEIRTAAEAKSKLALEFAAEQAMAGAQEARLALNKSNWGAAQKRLSGVAELVTLMEQVAPEGNREQVNQVRDNLGEVQRLVGEQSRDSLAALDSLLTDIDGLRAEEGET